MSCSSPVDGKHLFAPNTPFSNGLTVMIIACLGTPILPLSRTKSVPVSKEKPHSRHRAPSEINLSRHLNQIFISRAVSLNAGMMDTEAWNVIAGILSCVDHSRRPQASSVDDDPFGALHVLLFGDWCWKIMVSATTVVEMLSCRPALRPRRGEVSSFSTRADW